MRIQYRSQYLDYIPFMSPHKIFEKQWNHLRRLRQTPGLALGLHLAVWLIAAVLVYTPMPGDFIFPCGFTPAILANERADKADAPPPNTDSRNIQDGTSPVLTVASINPDSGVSITVSPSDVTGLGNGMTPFIRTYKVNMVVSLAAPSTAGGNNFQKWQRNGVDYASTAQITLTMDADYTFKAVYATPAVTQTLTVTCTSPSSGVSVAVSPNDVTGLGNGTTPFTRTYLDNTVVTLTAPPSAGDNTFVMWYRNGSPYSSAYRTSILMDAKQTLEALYEPIVKPKTRTLNVISSNPNGWDDGAVITIAPNDKNGQGNGTTPLVRYYDDGTVSTLIPIWFVEGNNFLYWEINGIPYVDNIVATITMDKDYTLIAHYAPPTISIGFAVYGQESVTIGKGTSISGGSVGVGAAAGESSSGGRLKIMGARIDGDVYGDTVYLGRGTRVQNVFANHFTNEKGRFKSLAPLPERLPRVLPLTGGNPAGEAVIVPAKGRTVLEEKQTDVHVEAGGTAVLSGGRYEFESLELGKGSRLMTEAPSFLIVNRSLQIGEKCVVGPSDSKVPLNLTIIVRGPDKNRPAAIIGASSKIQAAIRVPSGTLEMRKKTNAKGSYSASIVSIGEGVRIAAPQWDDTPEKDPQCLRHHCRSINYKIVCEAVVAEGASCDDGNACTVGDVCTAAGYCKSGSPITDPNPNNNPCRRNTCDPIAGIYEPSGKGCDTSAQCRQPTMCDGQGWCGILGTSLPQGTSCDDGIPNNGIDQCTSYGICKGPLGPYDCKANTCSGNASSPPDLTCWLNTHPGIRDQIVWCNPAQVYWEDWTLSQKQELEQAFLDAWNWLAGGMTNFQGTPIPEPPPNHVPGATTQFSEMIAWQLYLAKIAHNLAIEIGQWVPWSLCDYPTDMIYDLLSSIRHYWGYPEYTPTVMVTPAHPTFTYSFLSQNGLIGTTRHDTIAKLLDWGRKLNHYVGGWSAENAEAHWQYSGRAPVSRTIEGTFANIPGPTFGHWTAGCWGTTDFLTDVLRSVNIPVKRLSTCGHTQPYFISDGLYLSHGDDPYSGFQEGSTTVFPQPGEILIDQATYLNWFTGTPEYVCGNIGRRPAELMLQLLPDYLADYYCWDLWLNNPHDSGHVYDAFSYYYTLQELEAANLWDRLCLRAIELGRCNCQ